MITVGTLPQIKELKEAVAGSVIPIKFCYPGEGGDKWNQLRQDTHYTLGEREYSALAHTLSKVNLTKPTNIIHLGVGNGIEIPALIDHIDFSIHNYFGVDISQRMIANALRYQKTAYAHLGFKRFVLSDIETEGNLQQICDYAKRIGHTRNLLLGLGQGVLCSNPSFFKFVAKSLKEEDYFLLILEGDHLLHRNKILSTYNLNSVHDLLTIGLHRAGILKGKFLPARFNDDLHQVELYFRNNKRDILCLTSYKPPSAGQFRETLESASLQVKSITYYPKTNTYSALCKGKQHV